MIFCAAAQLAVGTLVKLIFTDFQRDFLNSQYTTLLRSHFIRSANETWALIATNVSFLRSKALKEPD
jgi:hypothetical protein